MQFLSDPNISFVLLVSGIVLVVLAVTAPGTGLIEIAALATIVLAGIGISTLPINPWALILLPLSLVAALIGLRRKPTWAYILTAAVLLAAGSVFLFRWQGGAPAVDPLVAAATTLTALVILWFVMRKAIEVAAMRPAHSLDKLQGMTGVARSAVHHSGTVYVNGEEWSARSEDPIPTGSEVSILSREGLVLIVEPLAQKQKKL